MRLGLACLIVTALAVGSVGCGGVTDPSQNVVETFTGIVTVGGLDFKTFNISRSGEFSISVLSLTPPASVFFIVQLGQVSGGSCAALFSTNLATAQHTVLTGPITSPGTYCVQVADQGVFTVPETYTVQVSHP
jgi:hypothetical protein